MAVILDQFVHSLVDSGLMSADEVQAFIDGLGPENRPTTSEDLAKLLFQRKKLTKFQAQAIYQGKSKGLIVGNYLVLDKIGQGGMGYVYKARHKRMKRVVALKVLPSAMTKTPEAVQRFQREVEVVAKLEHPNIVTAFDADEADGVHFLVMQYVKGSDLAALIREKGTLSVAKALDYLIQAGRGLDYAHAQGVIHRDIKPANLLLDDKGTVKILDMGLARLEQEVGPLDSTDAANLTQSGQVMGTVDYMPPEQSMDTHGADHRADIYSLGCTLYYLLAGRSVFAGDTLAQKIMAHRERPAPSLRALRSDVPEELDAVFQKMLAKRPEDRHAKMSAVLAELEACRAVIVDGIEETIAYQGQAAEIDTSNTQHEATIEKGADSALDRWLKEELPEGPTHFVTKPGKQAKLSQQKVITGSIVATVFFLALFLGIVFSIKTPEGTLVVTVNPPDAEILVDGSRITLKSPGDEPVEVEVVEGEHTLKVTKGGFQTHTETFSIKSRGREVFNVKLVPLVAAKPGPVGQAVPDAGKPKESSHPTPTKTVVERPTRQAQPDLLAEPDPAAWKALLPAGAPAAAIAPFDAAQAKKHQEVWAGYLGQPVEEDVDLGGGVKLTMVLIPPGEFLMGSTEEEQARFREEMKADGVEEWSIERIAGEGPQHWVRITRPFRLSRNEVTRGHFRQFVEETAYKTDAERDGEGGIGLLDGEWTRDPRFVWNADPGFPQTDDHPVVNVSWNDATAFCDWFSKKHGVKYELPTEAQWEYACRAGTTTFWHFGDSEAGLPEEYAWSLNNAQQQTHPVGQLKPNAWGLYDMHANVFELCADWYGAAYYAQAPASDPSGPTKGTFRVFRGGGWHYHAGLSRSAYRHAREADAQFGSLGFRPASVLADK